MASKSHLYAAGMWAADIYAAGIWRGWPWDEPLCTIDSDVTMASNSISTGVTMTQVTNTWDVTMASNSISTDVGMGCGNQ